MRKACCMSLKIGDKVRLIHGPEKGKVGTVQEINKNYTLWILLENGTKAGILACHIEKVD